MKRLGACTWRAAGSVLFLALFVVAPVFAGEVLTQGADLWETTTGFSFSSFAREPIPAGFFCAGSKPFTGVIQLHGEPLATEPSGALGRIDTIVRRMDDAMFGENGEASTRIQLMALSLASVKPVDTGCGLYDVRASLAGTQPVTTMKIAKTSAGGGYYIAPLELNVKLTFTPVAGQGERRELTHQINLGPGSDSVWSYAKPVAATHRTVRVDTDGDRVPDAVVPGPSNFAAGVAPVDTDVIGATIVRLCPGESCHCATSRDPYEANWCCKHLHCVAVWVDCERPVTKDQTRYGPCRSDGVIGDAN